MKKEMVARLGTISSMATAAVACSSSADAAVYSQVVGQTISTSSTISLNGNSLDPSFSPTFQVNFRKDVTYGDRYLFAPGARMDFINNPGNDVGRLGPNVLVSNVPAMNFWYQAAVGGSANDLQYAWINQGDTGFAGIRFLSGSDFYYGWIEITRLSGGDIRVDRWALESTPNLGITTPGGGGAVPEPASVGLYALAAGAAGIRALRRRTSKGVSA